MLKKVMVVECVDGIPYVGMEERLTGRARRLRRRAEEELGLCVKGRG